MRDRAPELLIAVGAVLIGVLLSAFIIGGSAPSAAEGVADPRALVWRHEPAAIEGGGLFGLDQLAPLPDRVVAVRRIWDEAAQREHGRVVSSTDGVSWTLPSGPIRDVPIDAVATVGGVVWAFGPLVEGDAEQEIWRTDDGVTWKRIERVTGVPEGLGRFMKVAGSGSTMLAIVWVTIDVEGGDQHLIASDDGGDWVTARQPRGPSYGLRTIEGDPAGFTALFMFEDGPGASFGEIWKSRDGLAWTQHPVAGPERTLNFFDMASGPGGPVVVGLAAGRGADYVPAAWLAPNAERWQAGSIGLAPGEMFGAVRHVLRAGDGFIAFGGTGIDHETNEVAWVSIDGSTWAPLAPWPVGSEREDVEGVIAWGDRVLATGQTSDQNGRGIPVVWIGEFPR